MSNIRAKDAKTVELLARRARRLAEPLVAHIPGGCLSVESTFGSAWKRYAPWSVKIAVYRMFETPRGDRLLAPMVLLEHGLESTEEIDDAIDKLRAIVADQSWPQSDVESQCAA
ncbi:hypothetical protein SLW73_02430 [Glutamicibacter protophormiae]|uniref:hypothetical protein n=1 Tax=Glutamicibacter protophormiae TaxID=37930 RepID=UPI002A82C8FA|nr:hypothetical protein [Glutamicibacter protophormiae]WPR65216.1 hypothetical protein SLW72_02430 [Glutamicibacter protophormiae]WPR68713.1 hypothetical protein SLW73_02430 [Glutamicibacter protophormiae]